MNFLSSSISFLFFIFVVVNIWIMKYELRKQPLAFNHVSVDCVIVSFDGDQLRVLLIRRAGKEGEEEFQDMKLPGDLIYMDEDLDEAAHRVLNKLTGIKKVDLMQFRAFGSKNRTSDPKDVHWLESSLQQKIERIVTIAYLAVVKVDRAFKKDLDEGQACWIPWKDIGKLAFDHNLIIEEALLYIRDIAEFNPAVLFELLPRKFTISQYRKLYERVYGKQMDIRNFHKRVMQTGYIVPLDEKQEGVPHRAARYYKFDKKLYLKGRK